MSILLWLIGTRNGRTVIAGILLLALFAVGYQYARHQGVVAANQKWEQKLAKERTEQAALRAKALDAQVTRELAAQAENEILQQAVNAYVDDLPKHPGGACDQLGPDDVGRLRHLQELGPRAARPAYGGPGTVQAPRH